MRTGKPDGAERVHVYQGGASAPHPVSAYLPGSPASDTALFNSLDSLKKYDVVLMPCEGEEIPKQQGGQTVITRTPAERQALYDYTSAGGRIFVSHYGYEWFINGPTLFQTAAKWSPQTYGVNPPTGVCLKIDTGFAKGAAFAQWMKTVTPPGSAKPCTGGDYLANEVFHNADVDPTLNPGTQPWITDVALTTPAGANPHGYPASNGVEYLTFNTPRDAKPEKQCGRAVFTGLHVFDPNDGYHAETGMGLIPKDCYPNGDPTSGTPAWTQQQLALEFLFFDLSSCVQPDTVPPQPPPVITIIK